MRAITFKKYGNPSEVLQVSDIDSPKPKGDELLIKVKATTVNDYDWSLVRGKPYLYRLMFGLRQPKSNLLGMEVAGEVLAIGPNVKKFKPGDHVYGDTSDVGFGTYAAQICLSEKAFTLKPDFINFIDAAATPHAALLAFQGIQNFTFEPQHRVLVNGAGGGVGSFAIQLIKQYGCHVTGVDTGQKLKELQKDGYDEVIDYKIERFTENKNAYDFILDCKSSHSFFAYRNALKPNGHFVTVGGHLGTLVKILIWSKTLPKSKGKLVSILALKANKGLETLHQLYQKDLLHPKIDGPHPLEEAAAQIERFGAGLHSGKIVLTP